MYLYLFGGLALSKRHISYSLKLHGGDITVQLENHACYNWRSHVIVRTRLAKRISARLPTIIQVAFLLYAYVHTCQSCLGMSICYA